MFDVVRDICLRFAVKIECDLEAVPRTEGRQRVLQTERLEERWELGVTVLLACPRAPDRASRTKRIEVKGSERRRISVTAIALARRRRAWSPSERLVIGRGRGGSPHWLPCFRARCLNGARGCGMVRISA